MDVSTITRRSVIKFRVEVSVAYQYDKFIGRNIDGYYGLALLKWI